VRYRPDSSGVLKGKSVLPTVRSRELGDALRAAMREAGLGVRELARRLDWPHPYLSHLLSGSREVSELDLVSIAVECRIRRDERDRLLRLRGDLGTRGWLQQSDSGPPGWRTIVDNERKATRTAEFQVAVIPRLLQTTDYTRMTLGRAWEREVRARQDLFEFGSRPRMTFFLHQFALRATAGDEVVMSEQLHHLLRMSVRPHVELRIVREIRAEAFTLMEFADFGPIVCLESEVSTVFLEEPQQIAVYRRVLEAVADTALDRKESQELIAGLAAGMSAAPCVLPR
jgi:transcriptional regulator with XRE-family HTH domain